MAKQVKKYTLEFKQEAVSLALKSPSIQQTATELGVPPGTLYSWVEKLKGDQSPSGKKNHQQPDMAALLEENRRLNKALARVTEEREILKKAATYFAQHQK